MSSNSFLSDFERMKKCLKIQENQEMIVTKIEKHQRDNDRP